jgi:hypothetical protein
MKGADVVNILILGGLFALGIVAILVVVVLARGEQGQNKVRANGTGVQAPSPVEPDSTSMPEVPVTSRSQRLTVPLDRTPTLVGLDEQSASVRLNQQFHELADEIRALHQHAWDLEQRLSALTEMVDRVERVQNGHTSVEEEQSLL